MTVRTITNREPHYFSKVSTKLTSKEVMHDSTDIIVLQMLPRLSVEQSDYRAVPYGEPDTTPAVNHLVDLG